MARLVHFRKDSGDYKAVAEQINGLISKHLPRSAWTDVSLARYRPSRFRLTFGLFIGWSQHVLMSHGAADKNYLYRRGPDGELHINKLEHLFVPGPWLRDKLLANDEVRLAPDQISCVGWPRLDLLLDAQRKTAGYASEQPRLLWAPTHDWRKWGENQVSASSYPAFSAEYDALGQTYQTEISLHPRNRDTKQPTFMQLLNADVVISDIGTMVYEAWALRKPVIFPTWLIQEQVHSFLKGSAEAHIFEHKIGYHPQSARELRKIIADGPVITPDVKAFMEEYLPSEFNGKSGQTIAKELLRLAGNKWCPGEAIY